MCASASHRATSRLSIDVRHRQLIVRHVLTFSPGRCESHGLEIGRLCSGEVFFARENLTALVGKLRESAFGALRISHLNGLIQKGERFVELVAF